MKILPLNFNSSLVHFKSTNSELDLDYEMSVKKAFRDDELFDKSLDTDTFEYSKYDNNDIPAFQTQNKIIVSQAYDGNVTILPNHTIDTDLGNERFKLVNGKLISLGNVYNKKFARGKFPTDLIKEGIENGLKFSDIFNVFDAAQLNKNENIISTKLIREGYALLKEGYPIESIVKMMNRAKIKQKNGRETYDGGYMKFMEEFGEHSKIAIETIDEEKHFNINIAHVFKALYEILGDVEEASIILSRCRTEKNPSQISIYKARNILKALKAK